MRFIRFLCILLMMATLCGAVLLGCAAAQRGTQKISGDLGQEPVLALRTEGDGITLTLFNETFRIRR